MLWDYLLQHVFFYMCCCFYKIIVHIFFCSWISCAKQSKSLYHTDVLFMFPSSVSSKCWLIMFHVLPTNLVSNIVPKLFWTFILHYVCMFRPKNPQVYIFLPKSALNMLLSNNLKIQKFLDKWAHIFSMEIQLNCRMHILRLTGQFYFVDIVTYLCTFSTHNTYLRNKFTQTVFITWLEMHNNNYACTVCACEQYLLSSHYICLYRPRIYNVICYSNTLLVS